HDLFQKPVSTFRDHTLGARALYQGCPDFATAACRRRSRAGGASTALAISRRSLPFVPAQAGTPVFPSARATPGSPLARGRTKWLVRPCSYSKAKADRPLLLAGRGGSPVFPSLSFPRVEGDGAPKGACSGFRRNGPDHAGRPGSAGSDASKT